MANATIFVLDPYNYDLLVTQAMTDSTGTYYFSSITQGARPLGSLRYLRGPGLAGVQVSPARLRRSLGQQQSRFGPNSFTHRQPPPLTG